jgi:hypothetical protein
VKAQRAALETHHAAFEAEKRLMREIIDEKEKYVTLWLIFPY